MPFLSMSQIEDAVLALLPSYLDAAFPVSALVDDTQKKLKSGPESRDRLERETELLLASREDLFLSNGVCYPKSAFFRGTRFRVIPGRLEVEKNLLLPGARFAPFCNPDIFPDEYTLTYGKKKSRMLHTAMRFSDLAPSFLLLGHSGMIDCLTAESNDNLIKLRSVRSVDRVEMEVSVLDMTEFYKENHFRTGDSVIFTVQDWTEGCFSMEYESESRSPIRSSTDKFLLDFEGAMLKVCENGQEAMEIPEQIAMAYLQSYEDGKDLRQNADFSFDNYPSSMREIAIRKDGPDWMFVSADMLNEPGMDLRPEKETVEEDKTCSCGHDHSHGDEHSHDWSCGAENDIPPEKLTPEEAAARIHADQFSISAGTLDSLEAILTERNAPLNPVELHAYAMDSLANGVEKFADYHERISSLLGIRFADDAQETAFLNFLEDDWEAANEYFNPAFETAKTNLRSRLLDLCEQRIDLSLRILARYREEKDGVPKDLARSFARFHQDVSETLGVFSTDDPLPEGEAGEQLELRVEDLEEAWDELADRAESFLGETGEDL